MQALALPLSLLAWLGRHGTRAVAISAILGLMLPQLSAFFRPYVPEAIFILLVLAFLRVDPIAVVGHMRRPRLIVAAMVWMQVIVPLAARRDDPFCSIRKACTRILRSPSSLSRPGRRSCRLPPSSR